MPACLFTQVGIESKFDLSDEASGPSVSLPARIGVGWNGFYERGSGDVLYGSMGAVYSHPFTLGIARWRLRAELLAMVRDARLSLLGGPEAIRATIVPLGAVSLSLAH